MALTKLNKNSSSDGILTDVEINTGTLAGTHILGYDTVSGAWVNANPSAWLIPSASQTVSGMTWSSSNKSLSITHADASFDSLSLTDVAMENSNATFADLTVDDISVDNGTNLLMRADAGLNKVQIFTELQVDGNVTATTFRQSNTGSNAFSLASNGRITTGENLVVTGTVTASGGNSGNWNTAYGWGDHASAGYLTSAGAASFDSLSSKTSGTGTYRTTGHIQSGTNGSGLVALTTNDGGGNANVTFNHADNAPDHAGYNTGRITVNVDSTTGASMVLSAGSGGAAPNSGLTIYENRISAAGRIDLIDGNLQLKQAADQLRVQTASGWGGFGPQNTSYCHITTDRSKFYMNEPLQVDGTISIYNGNVSLGGSGTIGGNTWANGTFHLGTSSSGWAMDPNEFYNSGAAIIGTLTGDLTLNPKAGSIVTGRPFVSTSTITASGGSSTNWNTAYGWGNHAGAGYYSSGDSAYFTNVNLVANNGNGIRFWNSSSYSMYMSSTADATWGGAVTGAATSDYNIYFQNSSGGTNRGWVFRDSSGADKFQITGAGNVHYSGQLKALCNSGSLGESNNYWPIEVLQTTVQADAMMSFHVANDYAVNFGLDGSTNKLSVGGWSMGSNMYEIYHAGNPPDKLEVATAGSSWYDILGHSGGTPYADTACHIHGSGYIQASYFNMTHAVGTRSSDTIFYSSTDSYIRKTNASGMRTALSVYSKAESDGKYLRNDANTDVSAHIEMQDNYEMRFGSGADVRMDFNGTDFYCRSYSHGARLLFQGERTSDGSNRALLYLDPDGEASIYHGGSKKGYTYSSGWRVTGNMLATSNVYAYYSDERLKDVVGKIDTPLEKVKAIDTFYYTHNDTARDLGYEGSERQVGVSAQSVQAVMPEVIGRAPIDDDGEGGSVTGEDYMTVQYERLVPLLIESIKTLTDQVESLGKKVKELEG